MGPSMLKLARTSARAVMFCALLVGVPTSTQATTLTPPCTIATLTVYENVSLGGDAKTFCFGTNVPRLSDIAHTQAGLCESNNIRFGDHWEDCISSARYTENLAYGNHTVCLFVDPNYGGSGWKFTSSSSSSWAIGTYADSFSSILWDC